MEMVLQDEALQKALIKKGLDRAKLFTWEKSAQEHMKVFEALLKK
jgi:glycosyltransferase involved in cell wall biosynthesis